MVSRSSWAPKSGHYNDVLVISYSWQGHPKLKISNLSSVKRSFSSRPFNARRKVLNYCSEGAHPRVNCLKTIPFTAAHTHIAHIWQYPTRGRELDFAFLFIQRGKFWIQWLAIVSHCTINQNFSSAVGIRDHISLFCLVSSHRKKKENNNEWWKKKKRILKFPVVNDLSRPGVHLRWISSKFLFAFKLIWNFILCLVEYI